MIWKDCGSVSLLLLALIPPVSVGAGSPPIGTIAGSLNASLSGEPIRPDTLVFSGDHLRVEDGAAVVALGQGGRLVLGRETEISFLRPARELEVFLEHGSVSMYQPGTGGSLCFRLGALLIRPLPGFKTLGDVALLDGMVVVRAKEGALRVQGAGPALDIPPGRTITLSLRGGRAPQGAPSAGAGVPPKQGGMSSLSQWVSLGVGTLGAVLGAVGVSHANSATDTANRALSTANSASSIASSATQAATAASAAAAAAAQAAQAATAAADAAAATATLAANVVGCDLNRLANSEGLPSPYTPFKGLSCGP
jgi:hypothetical protein